MLVLHGLVCIQDMRSTILSILLSLSSRLPEGDFGKILAKQGINYRTIINVSYDGMMVILKAIFGEESVPEVCIPS